MKHPQPVLVLSTGRTGTKFLASLLSNHFPKSARTQHESSRTRPINILTNMYFAGFIPKVFLPMTWKLLKQRELSKTELDFYIDINNFLYGIPVIEPELYPNLKVVHIIRDPRTYVRSHINWAHQNTKSFIANFWLPFWQPSPLFTGENFVGPRLCLPTFERFCWIWSFKNRLIASIAKSKVPYYCLRYEDLFLSSQPAKALIAMLKFIGLPETSIENDPFSHPQNVTVGGRLPDWHSWDRASCAQLQFHCGELMPMYGYGNEPDWIRMVQRDPFLKDPEAS